MQLCCFRPFSAFEVQHITFCFSFTHAPIAHGRSLGALVIGLCMQAMLYDTFVLMLGFAGLLNIETAAIAYAKLQTSRSTLQGADARVPAVSGIGSPSFVSRKGCFGYVAASSGWPSIAVDLGVLFKRT